ncbi:MAG: hydroxymethylpyrimidine/phosphomethylpyrimidine kinase [Acidobacteria bacterium]|nr:hydroxymethylpyrimidine/phosphomethylpyrimidine kinase [Acidobacteriota bacterium]
MNPINSEKQPVCLTIAGVDPSGGAGVIADVKTFSAFGCFATAAIASLTFQNTQGVFGAVDQTAATVRGQILPILDDFRVAALKTGMLPTGEIIGEVARIITEFGLSNYVVDPVVRSTSGFDLISDDALKTLIERLFPLATVVTPNVPEAERITGLKIESVADIRRAARVMQTQGAKNVLIKGGHLPISQLSPEITVPEYSHADQESTSRTRKSEIRNPKSEIPRAVDFLFMDDKEFTFTADFIETTATHGTGCTFAAAIAANLAHGKSLIEAVESAKKFVTEAIRTAPHLGKGHSPINQLVKI